MGNPQCVGGVKSNALKFDGVYSPDYVVIPNTADLSFNDNFTFSLWFNVQGNTAMDWWGWVNDYGRQVLLAKSGDREWLEIGLGRAYDDGLWYANLWNGRCCSYEWRGLSSGKGFGVTLDSWHLVTVTQWGGTIKLYVDGKLAVQDFSVNFNLNPGTMFRNLQLSIGQWQGWYPFNGIMDDVRVYNRAISEPEVQSLYYELAKPAKPTNLNQQIQSPGLEVQKVKQGEKVWKYQSGSWIILSANTNNTESSRLVADVYRIGDDYPKEFYSEYSTVWAKELTIPYRWAWDYYWKIRTETADGKLSDWVDFWTDNPQEVDYSLYEWFEPYPYGYKFANNVPQDWILDWWVGFNYLTWEKYKIDWNRWDIFNAAAPEYKFKSTNAMFDAFKNLWMENDVVFNKWSCFWMALSAAMQFEQPFYMNSNFYDFYLQVHTGSIWQNAEPIRKNYLGKWGEYNTSLKTILAFHLYQFSSSYSGAQAISRNTLTATGILEKIRDNPNRTYILSFDWEVSWTWISHAVIPYKVEGNKIYIWDNNYPYPKKEDDYAYNQFIEVNNWTFSSPNYDWKFTGISLVDVRDIDTSRLGLPDGFNGNDTVISAFMDSDLYLTDGSGRVSGYRDGNVFREIPWVYITPQSNYLSGWITDNTWKRIYLPQKIPGLTIKVAWKTQESYNLMIAWWDYYTEVSGVSMGSWQTDVYTSTNTGLSIDFDNAKTWAYGLMSDNFQDTLTGSIFLSWITIVPQPQKYSYDWTKALQNSSDAISYQLDTDNDGIYDMTSNFSALPKSLDEKWSISWYVKWDTNASMAGWKVCIDKNKNGTCEENKETFVITDNKGYYKFANLDKWSYSILGVPHQNWNVIKPTSRKYNIVLNNWQNIINLNFENSFTNWKGK